jgi:predicted nucleic acid-binding protein
MNYLLDTNILLRLSETRSPFHPICKQAISSLLAKGDLLFLCAQNLIEYWAVATRPATVNGLGFDPVQAEIELRDSRNGLTSSLSLLILPNAGVVWLNNITFAASKRTTPGWLHLWTDTDSPTFSH